MNLETIAKMAVGGFLGFFAALVLIPYNASYAYAAATRAITTITGMYIGSGNSFYKKHA